MAYDDRETGLTVEDRGSKLGLPQNQDAEANVLAAMLLSPEVVEEAQVELQPDDFYRPIHKTIYTAMVDMYNSRIPIDSISLIDYLRSINKLDAVGGEDLFCLLQPFGQKRIVARLDAFPAYGTAAERHVGNAYLFR